MKALKDAKGFTLIELLVVVAIIGILAAIAIPQFSEYRKRGFDARMQSDARNAATGEEAYFASNEEYTECTACDSTTLPGFTPSNDVSTDCACVTDCNTGFTAEATVTAGKGTYTSCTFNSTTAPNLGCS